MSNNQYINVTRLGGAPAPADQSEVHQHSPGVTRVVYGQAPTEAPAAAPHEASRVHGGAVRFDVGGTVESMEPARHVVRFAGERGGSVAATLQQQGPHQTVETIPGVPASRTRVDVALREGVIRAKEGGGFEDVAGAPQALEESLQEAPADDLKDPGEAHFDAADDATWAHAIADLSQPGYDAAVASVALAVVTGRDLSDAARSLAANEGLEVELAERYVEAGAAMHERVVARAVAPLGIEGERRDAFYAYTREHPAKLQQAVQQLVQQRDPAGFVKMAQQFRRAHPGDLSAYQAAGFETHIDTAGEVLLKRPGGNWVKASELGK